MTIFILCAIIIIKGDNHIDKKEEQQKIYGFRPDVELKYLFTHADHISVIHLLNTLFRTHIPDDSTIEIANTEFVEKNFLNSKLQNRRADMIFKTKELPYKVHLEFQSTKDPTMGIRAFLYGLYTGLESMEENKIIFPFSHILYTTSGKDKKGKDIVQLCFPKMSEDATHCEETIVSIDVDYTNLLAMDFNELLSDDFVLLSFMYFYQYLKYESRTNSDKKVLKIVSELQEYINTLGKLKQQDREVLLRSIDTLVDDILNIIKGQANISKEVMDMLLEEYKTIADVRIEKAVEKAVEKAEQKSRQEEKENTIINLYHLKVDIPTIAKGVNITEQEVLDIISKNK